MKMLKESKRQTRERERERQNWMPSARQQNTNLRLSLRVIVTNATAITTTTVTITFRIKLSRYKVLDHIVSLCLILMVQRVSYWKEEKKKSKTFECLSGSFVCLYKLKCAIISTTMIFWNTLDNCFFIIVIVVVLLFVYFFLSYLYT